MMGYMMEYQERGARGVLKMLAFIGGAIFLAYIVISISMLATLTIDEFVELGLVVGGP